MYVKCAFLPTLKYFLPDYVIRDSLTVLDSGLKVIYTGRLDKGSRHVLENLCFSFIATSPNPEWDLNDKEQFLTFLNTIKNGWFTKKHIGVLIQLPDEEFLDEVKRNWLVRQPYLETDDTSMFKLFQTQTASLPEQIKVFLSIDKPISIIESSFFTFLNRVLHFEQQAVSPAYSKLLREVNERYSKAIYRSVSVYLESGYLPQHLRFLNFLISLRNRIS